MSRVNMPCSCTKCGHSTLIECDTAYCNCCRPRDHDANIIYTANSQ